MSAKLSAIGRNWLTPSFLFFVFPNYNNIFAKTFVSLNITFKLDRVISLIADPPPAKSTTNTVGWFSKTEMYVLANQRILKVG